MDRRVFLVFSLVATFATSLLQAQQPCPGLLKNSSSIVSITLATEIDSGSFTPGDNATGLDDLPSFCRIIATLRPTSDSDIQVEVWLPTTTWNGKFLAVGGDGWGGSIA